MIARMPRERNGPGLRKEILNTLRHEPGLTKSQLCRRLDVSWGAVWHHVRRLESDGEIIRKKTYGWTGLFASSTPRLEMTILPLLRDDAALRILAILRDAPGLRMQEITRQSQLSRKMVRRRLDRLAAAGLVDRSSELQAKYAMRGDVLALARRQLDSESAREIQDPAREN